MPPSPCTTRFLQNNSCGVLINHLFQRRDVVAGNEARAGHQGLEVLAIFGLPSDRERAERSTVERILKRDHIMLVRTSLVAVGANHLQSALHRLRAGIAEKYALHPADFRDALRQRSLILVVVKIRGVEQKPCLLSRMTFVSRGCA